MAIKNYFSIFIITVLILLSGYLNNTTQPPLLKITKQDSAINIKDDLIKIFDIGQSRLLSDLIWISTLIESDLSHYKAKDLNSWMYLRFKTISSLDPLFLRNYTYGGQYLAIVKDDVEGAEDIFLKGSKYYPKEYKINFNLGYIYAIEKDEYEKSIHYFNILRDNYRLNERLQSLIAKISHMANKDFQTTFDFILELYENSDDEYLRAKLEKDLYSIKATMDLKCLNSGDSNCDKVDFKQQPYIFDGNKYKTQDPFNPYKIFKQN